MFSGLKRWLGIDAPRPLVGLRPHRTVEMPLPYDEAYDRVYAAMEAVLGANVRDADRSTGVIDADFGTIGSERIRAMVERAGETTTRLRIEARYPATATPSERSRAVEALADALTAR